jgi:hypothetical protein
MALNTNESFVDIAHQLHGAENNCKLLEIKTVLDPKELAKKINNLTSEEIKIAENTVNRMYPLKNLELNQVLPKWICCCV